MRGNTLAQIQELSEPVLLQSAELCDRDKVIRTTDHRADRNGNQIPERVIHFRRAEDPEGLQNVQPTAHLPVIPLIPPCPNPILEATPTTRIDTTPTRFASVLQDSLCGAIALAITTAAIEDRFADLIERSWEDAVTT